MRQLETRGSKGLLLCNLSSCGQTEGVRNVCRDVCVDVHQGVCTSNGSGAVLYKCVFVSVYLGHKLTLTCPGRMQIWQFYLYSSTGLVLSLPAITIFIIKEQSIGIIFP